MCRLLGVVDQGGESLVTVAVGPLAKVGAGDGEQIEHMQCVVDDLSVQHEVAWQVEAPPRRWVRPR